MVSLCASDTLRETKHRHHRRARGKVDGLCVSNVPGTDLELEVSVVHDVDTTRTGDTGCLQPTQTLNTHCTIVSDRTQGLGDGDGGCRARSLTQVDLTSILPIGSGTKDNRWRQGVRTDTKPHVTRIDKAAHGVQVIVTHHTGPQGIEGKVA